MSDSNPFTREEYEGLLKERDMLRLIVNHLPDLIYVKDAESRYLLSNEAHAKFTGFKNPQEVEGKSVLELYPKEISQKFFKDDHKIIFTKKPIIGLEEPTIDRQGKPHWLSTTKVPYFDPDGKAAGLIGMSRDITDRKLAQDKVKEFAEKLEVKNKEFETNLKLATELMQSLLPDRFPEVSSSADGQKFHLNFDYKYIPSEDLGGDFFGVELFNEHRVGIYICDVMGHDIRAAMVTSIINGLFENSMHHIFEMDQLVSSINQDFTKIMQRSEHSIFASLLFCMIDISDNTLTFVNAGHQFPMIYSAAENRIVNPVDLRKPAQPALGIKDSYQYQKVQMKFSPGDKILLYTDGILEIADRFEELFGEKRISEFFLESIEKNIPTPLDFILGKGKEFSERNDFEDDLCMLLVEYDG